MSDIKPLMTIPEAAAVLNITANHMYRLIRAGSVPCVHIGRYVRLRPADVERALENGWLDTTKS